MWPSVTPVLPCGVTLASVMAAVVVLQQQWRTATMTARCGHTAVPARALIVHTKYLNPHNTYFMHKLPCTQTHTAGEPARVAVVGVRRRQER